MMPSENIPIRQFLFKRSTPENAVILTSLKVSLLIPLLLIGLLDNPVCADITAAPDGTGTDVKPNLENGNQFDISGGRQAGSNLFHSFSAFGLNANQIANFISNPAIRNILGRVSSGNPSVINGLIKMTGGNSNLFLMNPAGIIFGPNARLNVPAAFAATTANGIRIGPNWFNATGVNDYSTLSGTPNAFAFTMEQPGAIVNSGDLSVGNGQSLSLIGGMVVNTGQLSAPGGHITVAAVPGKNLVRISQEGNLLSLEIQPPAGSGSQPQDWTLPILSLPQLLTAGGGQNATNLTVNSQGQVEITGSDLSIDPVTGTTIVSGTLNASSSEPGKTGGSIQVLGDRLTVANASINASGASGGGTVLIGGAERGKGSIPTAQQTYISADSTMNADAWISGNGGTVILWSEQNTQFKGKITARGGAQGGDGGFVETSSRNNVQVLTGAVDASAPQGQAGTWLLDPTDITIVNTGGAIGTSEVGANVINAALNSGTNVTITTNLGGSQAGNITQNADAPIQKTSGSPATLTLQAANNITLNGGITAAGLYEYSPFVGGPTFGLPSNLNLVLTANDASQGGGSTGTVQVNSRLQTNGGNLTISGKSITTQELDTSTSIADLQGRNGFEVSSLLPGETRAVSGGDVTLTSTAGNIIVSDIETSSPTQGSYGGDVTINANGLFRAVDTIGGSTGTVSIFTAGFAPSPSDRAFVGGSVNIKATSTVPFQVGVQAGSNTPGDNSINLVRIEPFSFTEVASGTRGAIVSRTTNNASRTAYTDMGFTNFGSGAPNRISVSTTVPPPGSGNNPPPSSESTPRNQQSTSHLTQ
jgi:filamentous hemagglutinin family protein